MTDSAASSPEALAFLPELRREIARVLIGQDDLVDVLLIGLLTGGHVLIEGLPGLAKTLAVKTLAATVGGSFSRIQFTPDLLPADIIGACVYLPDRQAFEVRPGPIAAHIVLADEINRAPAKVQSALLEAMQERQITIGDETFKLQDPFLVLATQNPVEQEGTYPLPEAQVDRFMFKLKVDYPGKEDELKILRRMASSKPDIEVQPILCPAEVTRLRELADDIFMDHKIEEYIVSLVDATRHPADYGLEAIRDLIHYGASPRATIYLSMAAKGQALLEGRGYVTPQDVKSVALDVLRHRVILSYEAEAEEKTPEDLIQQILNSVKVP